VVTFFGTGEIAMSEISRRALFKTAGAAGAAAISPAVLADAAEQASPGSRIVQTQTSPPAHLSDQAKSVTYAFFNAAEAEFLESAVARLIPADARWPGALEAGVSNYIDKQMAGAWGAGERLYRSGPWQAGTASQGYQLPLTPAELFRTAIAAINKELAAKGTPFGKLPPAEQDTYLMSLETGSQDLGGVPAKEFFAQLWQATLEGFFGDPVYGGNRDMVAWRMIGFPGAYASYYDLVDKHGIAIDRAPMSLAEDATGHVHVDPNIAPKLP
jgi:gluconate 2-dehydrogenase gamma chain